MDSHELIDAQFDRAVEIIQGLPKTGPIQTGYEEKLTMYSLYKQATVGNVQGPRPGLFDMLGRAKWDAWAKHKELDSYEAKWLYVDVLLKVLRKYSDKTMARDLVRELEAFEGDPANIMMSGSMSHTHEGSDSSDSEIDSRRNSAIFNPNLLPAQLQMLRDQCPQDISSEDEASEDEAHIPPPPSVHEQSIANRPQSSLSSHRYRTPMAGSMMMTSPPPIPEMQPMPGFSTPSAFAGPSSPSHPASSFNPSASSYGDQYSHVSQELAVPPGQYGQPGFRGPSAPPMRQYALHQNPRPIPTLVLERALENIQAHLAALSERMDLLEARPVQSWASHSSGGARGASPFRHGSPSGTRGDGRTWTPDEMGLWSIVIRAVRRMLASVRAGAALLAHDDGRSPTWMVVRRLFLDLSFVLCVLALMKTVWRRTGLRRREVFAAFGALVGAIVGRSPQRVLVERAV